MKGKIFAREGRWAEARDSLKQYTSKAKADASAGELVSHVFMLWPFIQLLFLVTLCWVGSLRRGRGIASERFGTTNPTAFSEPARYQPPLA